LVTIRLAIPADESELCIADMSVGMSHAASGGDFTHPMKHPTISAVPLMQPVMQLPQPGFVNIRLLTAADFAASSVLVLRLMIVATSQLPDGPAPPPPVTFPIAPGALQLFEAQQTTFMYTMPPVIISVHVWRVLTIYAVFTAPDACSAAVHDLSLSEQWNEYETQTISSPGGAGIGTGPPVGPVFW
jgi:hypothetical protein